MPRATIAPILRNKGESLSLTTTRIYAAKYQWAKEMQIESTTEARFVFCPPLMAALFFDQSADTYTDVLSAVTDKDAATQAVLNDMTSLDFLYLFFDTEQDAINKFFLDLGALNDNASVMSLDYRKNDDTWAAVAGLSDGTDVAGDTLKQDGEVTWTLTTDHKFISPNTVSGAGTSTRFFAVRISVSATLDASVDIDEIIPGNADTDYNYIPATTLSVYNVTKAGSIIALHDTATATMRVNHIEYDGE